MKIAFGYKLRSGKDTAVDYLLKKYNGNRITFAKPLYDSLHATQKLFNFDIQKNREYLQIVGDWARNIDKDVFVSLALLNVNDSDNENYFCNDLRFLNEFNMLKKNNWTLIKIIRNHSKNDNHQSEKELDNIDDKQWDYIILNNGTLEEFYDKIENVISKIKNKTI